MPANRNALIRYKTIDKCLQNHYRTWTLENLIDAVSDALYEYEGIDKGVSRRTVQGDIQMMRSDKLGYNAPIVVIDRKFYSYEDRDYSITNIPITDQDLGRLMETVEFLKEFKGFSHFKELDAMVQKLEDQVYAQKTHQKPVIDMEKNENLKGLGFLEPIYQAIIQKKVINLTYQSFKARNPSTYEFHPYLLKEFRNRWFIIGVKDKQINLITPALDRIIDVELTDALYRERPDFSADDYFKDAIGVSVSPNLKPISVEFFVNHTHAPYVMTKPLHWSQKQIGRNHYGVTFSMEVQHNFELEKELLAFGDGIMVIKPERLKRSIKARLEGAIDLYNTDIHEKGLVSATRKLEHKGFSILNNVYTQRSLKRINKVLDTLVKDMQNDSKSFAIGNLLNRSPELKELLMSKNLSRILESIDPKSSLVKAVYFNRQPKENRDTTWHQDRMINVTSKKELEGYSGWTQQEDMIGVIPPIEVSKKIFSLRIHINDTDRFNGCLRVISGSHKKVHSDNEITVISENSIPYDCEVASGGVILMKPLLLHSSTRSSSQQMKRVIHLEFSSVELPEPLEWSEKTLLSF